MDAPAHIHHCRFSKGRDGIMVQRHYRREPTQTGVLIEKCVFTNNRMGVWAGFSAKATIRGSRFIRNGIGVVDAGGGHLQERQIIAKNNVFERNKIADYAGDWSYNDGTMRDF
jgi:polygalacturonase